MWQQTLVVLIAATMLGSAACRSASGGKVDPTPEEWLADVNERLRVGFNHQANMDWDYASNMTDHNNDLANEAGLEMAKIIEEIAGEISTYEACADCDMAHKRQMQMLSKLGAARLQEKDFKEFQAVTGRMGAIYAQAKVKPAVPAGMSYSLEPELGQIMAKSRNYWELLFAWASWRDETGPKMKDDFETYVTLLNKAAVINGFKDASEMWLFPYTIDDKDFLAQLEKTWQTVKPLYQQLHAYVRHRLQKVYGAEQFPEREGHIPAHILGNMWAQSWSEIYDLVIPYPDETTVNIDAALQSNVNFNTPKKMFEAAEAFFSKIGMYKMTDSFWEKSILEKNNEVEMVCHASAWDFLDAKTDSQDFRIKQCTEVTGTSFQTAHHEMGHIEYFMAYKNQATLVREGANPGFHEAVGDLIALSVMTDEHLEEVGLIDEKPETNEKADINVLMRSALSKVAFLPFGYLIDKYRWRIFQGETTKADYNEAWWQLRCGMQGVSSPTGERADADGYFDAGAKNHVPTNVPYIRYYFSFIAQFQFHEYLCTKLQPGQPLHRCDISAPTIASAEAQKVLREHLLEPLQAGQSVSWLETFEQMTGSKQLDAGSLMTFYKPLYEYLEKENKANRVPIGWYEDGCYNIKTTAASAMNPNGAVVLIVSLAVATLLNKLFK